MTTIDSAAVRRAKTSLTLATFAAFVGLTLAGCGTTTGLFTEASDSSAASTDLLANNSAAAAQASQVAIAPVIGAPEQIASQMQTALGTSMQSRQIASTSGTSAAAAYTLRGYIVAAREQAGTKISYIWDVNDRTGNRVNRITGEEIATSGASRDPWASVTPQVISTIADKTAASLATWLQTQTPVAPAAVAGASIQKTAVQTSSAASTGVTTAADTASQVASTTPAALGTTGSIQRGGALTAVVPSVTGAPGDGSVSLTRALQSELSRNGVSMAQNQQAGSYRVEGSVKVGQGSNGKQPIQIDWDVKDLKGKKLGTVSQKNDIPQGSLDGAWGQTANAAAAAAAQGILKLMKENSTRVN